MKQKLTACSVLISILLAGCNSGGDTNQAPNSATISNSTAPTNAADTQSSLTTTETKSIASGTFHNLVITPSGELYVWGGNSNGQLGNGVTQDQAQSSKPSGLSSLVVAADGGWEHSLALLADGSVWAWGFNQYGQLGNGKLTDSLVPVRTVGLPKIKAIAAGLIHSLALSETGQVWGWGTNTYGQLGNSTTNLFGSTPVQTPGLNNIIKISAGQAHSLALDANGHIWAWGGNESGQVGNGTNVHQLTPFLLPAPTNVVAIAAGALSSAAITSDGHIWTWGDNRDGQLGDGTKTNRNTPKEIPGLTGVVDFCFKDHMLAVNKDGAVWAWGNNQGGKLGFGTPGVAVLSPQPVASLSGVQQVACGALHSVAKKNDGSVWVWGANNHLQLGNNGPIYSLTPYPVAGQIAR